MLFRFKVWLLNLQSMAEVDGTPFGNLLEQDGVNSQRHKEYDYYKVFHNNPNFHMMYSISYLQSTSVIRLLLHHQHWSGYFRRVYLMGRDMR